eukprot:COSAG03_NODE_18231_length_359_cov_0.784615_1_plen_39_part_01
MEANNNLATVCPPPYMGFFTLAGALAGLLGTMVYEALCS